MALIKKTRMVVPPGASSGALTEYWEDDGQTPLAELQHAKDEAEEYAAERERAIYTGDLVPDEELAPKPKKSFTEVFKRSPRRRK